MHAPLFGKESVAGAGCAVPGGSLSRMGNRYPTQREEQDAQGPRDRIRFRAGARRARLCRCSSAEPGPNGKNDFGLCKAYLNGSENKRDKGPFPALEEKADEAGQDVEEYCRGVFPGGKESSPGDSGVNGADNPSPQG
jgi:hypothetical protein